MTLPLCRICKSRNTRVERVVDVYTLLRCSNCRMVFVHPQPRRKTILQHNARRYDTKETMELYRNMEEKFFQRARVCVEILKKGLTFLERSDLSRKKLLDVGCSAGYYLKIFQESGFAVQGIDVSPLPVEYAKKHYRVAACVMSLDELPDRPAQFDVITLFDVIEHLPDPAAALKKLHRLLKPEGILVLQTPNFDSFIQRITGSRWYWLLVPQHLFLFSPRSIEYFLSLRGASLRNPVGYVDSERDRHARSSLAITHQFKILRMQTWDDMYEFWSNLLTIIGLSNTGNYPRLHRRIVRVLQAVTTPLSWTWSMLGYGGELVVYARKK